MKNVKAKFDELNANGPVASGSAPTTSSVATPTQTNDSGAADVDMEEYSNKALVKTDELGEYIRTISDKATPFEDANKAIDLACGLFIKDGTDSRIEVSKLSSKKKDKYLIRTYLGKLKLTKYDQVKLSWANIDYVSQLKKGPDGNYYGVVTLQQTFEGFIDGKVVYKDVTKKNITIILKAYKKEVEGEAKELWDVFLSDVGVVETKN